MLVWEKCLQPKKPRYDDSGEGCGAVRMQCFAALISDFFLMAYEPQSIKTIGLMLLRITLKDIPLTAINIIVVSVRKAKLTGFPAIKTETIKRVARMIFVLGSRRWIGDLPGKN